MRPKKGGNRYPWNRWFARPWGILRRGRDYFGRTDTMIQLIRATARRWNLRVSCTSNDALDAIYLTVLGPRDTTPAHRPNTPLTHSPSPQEEREEPCLQIDLFASNRNG